MVREILPVEQIPAIAASLSKVFQDSRLSIVGSDNQVLGSILPLIQTISEVVGDTIAPNDKNGTNKGKGG